MSGSSEVPDMRRDPHLYRVGKGEQGVFTVQPYKSQLLPLWRFATPDAAQRSSRAILRLFRQYVEHEDFVGADMARKYLQMGFTRARRYANHRSGRKYAEPVSGDATSQSGTPARRELPRGPEDPGKAEAARIFKAAWDTAAADLWYRRARAEHRDRYG